MKYLSLMGGGLDTLTSVYMTLRDDSKCDLHIHHIWTKTVLGMERVRHGAVVSQVEALRGEFPGANIVYSSSAIDVRQVAGFRRIFYVALLSGLIQKESGYDSIITGLPTSYNENISSEFDDMGANDADWFINVMGAYVEIGRMLDLDSLEKRLVNPANDLSKKDKLELLTDSLKTRFWSCRNPVWSSENSQWSPCGECVKCRVLNELEISHPHLQIEDDNEFIAPTSSLP